MSENNEAVKKLKEHFHKLATDSEYVKQCRKEYEEAEAKKREDAFFKRNACPDCGTQMVERGSWTKGDSFNTPIGSPIHSTGLYQCPKCKTVRIE